MNYWILFWSIALVVAGTSFAVITAIVAVKGYKDLRIMFSRLAHQRNEGNE